MVVVFVNLSYIVVMCWVGSIKDNWVFHAIVQLRFLEESTGSQKPIFV